MKKSWRPLGLTEDGAEGSGIPKAFIIGKGQKMPRGWELALYGE